MPHPLPTLLLTLSLLPLSHAAPPPADPLTQPGPDGFRHNGITAHRGDQSAAPENTLQAFSDAVASGADWIELDVFTTRDGHVVVSHDPSTQRAAGQNLKITDSTYDQLKQLDVATSFRNRNNQTPATCPPARLPLLAEALALIKRHPHVRLSIQPKDDSTERAVRLVQQMDLVRQVGFNDSSLPKMTLVKQLDPRIRVHWDRPATLDLAADLATARKLGFESFVVNHKAVTPDLVRQVKAAGLEMGVWTVTDPAAARRFLDMGVDRLYTDYPRLMLDLKRNRPASSPTPAPPPSTP